MSLANCYNVGALIKPIYAAGPTNLTAAGSGDNTLVNGSTIDLTANGYPLSASAAFTWKAVLTSAQTLSLSYAVQHSTDSSTWTNLSAAANGVISTGGSGGTTNTGCTELEVNLAGAHQYVRVAYTPDLSHTGTDTANVMATLILGGQPTLPV